MTRTLADDLMGTGLGAATANLISRSINDLGAEAIPDTEKGAPNGVATLDSGGKVPMAQLPTGANGLATLDGNGKISAAELPPLEHDVVESANEAGMLAASVTAPAICIRTDFTPPHVFYLTADPATEVGNWTDTGEFGGGAANPTATVGLTAKNGVATSYMRSDGAPALDQTIAPTWTGTHTWNGSAGTKTTVISGDSISQSHGYIAAIDNGNPVGLPGGSGVFLVPGNGIEQLVFQNAGLSAGNRRVFMEQSGGNGSLGFMNDQTGTRTSVLLWTGGAASGITGIQSNSGSGAWAHTGAFSTSGAATFSSTSTFTGAATFQSTVTSLETGGNGVTITPSANGGIPSIAAVGANANVTLDIAAKGAGGINLKSPTAVTGTFSTTGAATFGGNVYVAGQLGSANNTSAPGPTNSGITIGGAPTWAMASFYDQALTANNRSADLLFITNSIKLRFANDARNAYTDIITFNGGQALGVTGITSTSGSGAWEHTGTHTVIQPNDVYKTWLAKNTTADSQSAPTTIGAASTYLQIGGREWKNNGVGGIGFGYVTGTNVNPPVWIGWEEKVTSGNTYGDFIIATRNVNTNTAPTERFRVTAAGDATFTNTVKTGGYTVATMPAASAALQGARAYVTDSAASPAFMAAVAGGGSTVAPVFCNGTAWVYG